MKVYKNAKTGAVITTDLIISGGDWELLKENTKKTSAKKTSNKSKNEAEDDEN